MPRFLHGEVITTNQYASTMNALRAEETLVAELPTRIARLCTDVASRWAVAEGAAEATHAVTTQTCQYTPRKYLQSLLSGEGATTLTPAELTETQAKAPVGEILERVNHSNKQAPAAGLVAVQFREKFGFCITLNSAVRKAILSYERQTGEGKL